ncbi:hypothetical protein C3941_16600, partial [Kaistia algarum]
MAQSKNRPFQHRADFTSINLPRLRQDGWLGHHRRSLLTGAAILSATAIVMVMASTAARAGNIQWIGDGSWSDPSNWKLLPGGEHVLPGGGDYVFIHSKGANVDSPGAYARTLTVSGSSLTVSSGGTLGLEDYVYLGRGENTFGAATVTGKGAVLSASNVSLGWDKSNGTLLVSDGGKVNSGVSLDSGGSLLTITGAGSELKGEYIRLYHGNTIVSDGGTLSGGYRFELPSDGKLYVGGGSTNPADAKAPGFIKSSVPILNDAAINFNHTDQ